MTDSRALYSHIVELERQIDRKIPSSTGFVVSLKSSVLAPSILKEYGNILCNRHKAIMAYVFSDSIIGIFFADSSRAETTIFSVVSLHVSELSRLLTERNIPNVTVQGKTIIIDSKLQMFSYLHTAMFNNSKDAIIRLHGELSRGKLHRFTFKEIVALLKEKGIDWLTLPHIDKWGIILRPGGVEKEIVLDFAQSATQMEDLFD